MKGVSLGAHLSFVSRSTLDSGAPFTPIVDKRKANNTPEDLNVREFGLLSWGDDVESPSIRRARVAKAITGDPARDLLLGWVEFHVKVGCCMFLEAKFCE